MEEQDAQGGNVDSDSSLVLRPTRENQPTIALPLGVHPDAVLSRTARPAASEHPAEE
jgi:hypothetical protein